MPVGCWLNHVIIRKQPLIRAAAQVGSRDRDVASFVNALLQRQHQDAYLIAVEDMGGDDGLVQRLADIGLRNSYSDDCTDFYSPYFGCARATWLEEAPIKNVPDLSGEKSSTRWIAYRLIGDVSRNIVLDELAGSLNFKPDFFPQRGHPVDPTKWPEEQWSVYPLDHPMRKQWFRL